MAVVKTKTLIRFADDCLCFHICNILVLHDVARVFQNGFSVNCSRY